MNRNNTKKIRVWFSHEVLIQDVEREATKLVQKFLAPLDFTTRLELAKEKMSDVFAGQSNMQLGNRYLPKIEGFNCTWISRNVNGGFEAQFTFASAEEKKVRRIIEKSGGKIVNPDEKLHQYEIEETDLTNQAKQHQVELANEILKVSDF